jgi:NIPSNAP
MLYELRIYDCVPGRLPALLNRFQNHTTKIWERHGIKQGGFWTTVIGGHNHRLYYFLVWNSLAEREEKWAKFQADPEWNKARSESEKDGPIVANVISEILTPTAFSSLK